MTASDIITAGLALVYVSPDIDKEAAYFAGTVLQALVADCFDAEQNSRADDDQLEAIPTIRVGGSGDVNQDGNITPADAVMILQYLAGTRILTNEQKAIADVDGNGVVNTSDAEAIMRSIVDLESFNIPYNDHLTRVALPYGIAWRWCDKNDRPNEAEMFRQLYEKAKHEGGSGKWM